MSCVLVIGYGNPLRGDDGVGIRAAELLAGEWGPGSIPGGGMAGRRDMQPPFAGGDCVEVLACHQLTLELAPQVAAADRLILMDACAGDTPGVMTERRIEPLIPSQTTGALAHHLDPAGLLAAAQILYGRAPETVLLTVAGASFDYNELLSEPVAAALPCLVARVRQLVAHG